MPDPLLDQVGPRLKGWRVKRGLTLDDLAAATGISASTISRLEAGKRAPNLELVVPLARAMRLELDDIVPRSTPDPRVQRAPKKVGDTIWLPLSPPASELQTYKVTMPRRAGPPDTRVHDGYEWLYVLDGRLRLVLGDHEHELGAGEAAEFDTRTPHWLSAAGDRPVELLTIFSKQGTRIHLRSGPAADN